MGLFIELEIDRTKCVGLSICGQCIKVCPVQIFGENGDLPLSIVDNEDECTLCNLCIDSCDPEAIRVCKLYD